MSLFTERALSALVSVVLMSTMSATLSYRCHPLCTREQFMMTTHQSSCVYGSVFNNAVPLDAASLPATARQVCTAMMSTHSAKESTIKASLPNLCVGLAQGCPSHSSCSWRSMVMSGDAMSGELALMSASSIRSSNQVTHEVNYAS